MAEIDDIREQAEAGDAAAQFQLAQWFDRGEQGLSVDYEKAFHWYKQAGEQGHTEAQFAVGLLYNLGQGVDHDDVMAANWFLRAANAGLDDAQFNLGLMLYLGEGIGSNHEDAARWFTKAAEQGHTKAQFNLGVMFANGEGVQADAVETAKWWTLAAMQGHAGAAELLDSVREQLTADELRIVQESTASWYSKQSLVDH